MPTNRLYDSESIADNPYQLPVDAPQFDTQPREPVAREPLRFTIHPDNMTPGPPSSSTGEGDGAGYKLTPVDYNPWAESQTHKVDTKRAPLSDMQEMARKGATAVAGMPYALLKNLIVDPIKGAANLTNRTLGGEFVGNTAEDVGMAMGAASLGGSGGLLSGPMEGAVLGSGPIKAAAAEVVKAPTFYSAVEHAVENVKQNKASGEQWLATLQNSRGVKPEELDWTGLRDFLAEKAAEKKSVTKAEVQDYINANKVELKEINKGFSSEEVEALRSDYEKAFPKPKLETIKTQYSEKNNPEYENWINKRDDYVNSKIDNTKYSKYQLPGGENYRETLLTLPDTGFNNWYNKNWNPRGDTLFESLPSYTKADVLKDYKKETGAEPPAAYKSSHWDEPNILAHVRMNDRMIEGKKSLHLEEIQSDWHQQGREKGYINSEEFYNKIKENEKKFKVSDATNTEKEALRAQGFNIKKIENSDLYTYGNNRWSLNEPANRETINSWNQSSIPDAPFKKTWHELVLKRMIREAAEKGYDKLSWTPGDAQALRYPDEMRRQVSSIEWHDKEMSKVSPTGNKQILISPRNGTEINVTVNDKGVVTGGGLSQAHGKHLSEVIGKDMAKDVLNKGEGHIDAKDFVMGAEGMKGFYDKMIPNYLEKLGKEHGVKVKTAEINVDKNYKSLAHFLEWGKENGFNYDGGRNDLANRWKNGENDSVVQKYISEQKKQPVHYIDIPKSLKDQAMHKGFPLFSGGIMFSPVQGDPFEKK